MSDVDLEHTHCAPCPRCGQTVAAGTESRHDAEHIARALRPLSMDIEDARREIRRQAREDSRREWVRTRKEG